MSQRQLSISTGLARIGIARYEQGLAEPRMDSINAIARELGVEAREFFEWDTEETEADLPPEKTGKESVSGPPPPPQDPLQSFIQNMALLNRLDLRSLSALLEGLAQLQTFFGSLTESDNPLEYDQDLYDRDLAELQQTTPNALPSARQELGLSIHEVSKLSKLSSERLMEIESGRGMLVQPSEIMALRQALGVRYEPRAIAIRTTLLFPSKDRRSARAKFHDSVQEWNQRCQRTPNKIDTVLHRIEALDRRFTQMEAQLRASPT
jgi:transcriptional regulator with XRE-family HTH domain